MQYRPKVWIGTLIVLFLIGFEVGFQPLRVIAREKATTAAFEFSLGQPAATDEAGLTKKAEQIKDRLIKAARRDASWIPEARFVSDQQLRVSTVILMEKDREEDRATILAELKKEFPKAQAAASPTAAGEGEQPVASLGPIGIYRPMPHVHLGLDLQGGAHVVLQAMPSTEMTFSTPEDKPMVSGHGKKPEGAETKAAEEGKAGKAGEGKAGEEKAAETRAAPTETKAEATPASATPAAGAPSETRDSLKQKLTDLLVAQGATSVDVQVVAPNLVRIYTRAIGEKEADQERTAVRKWLQEHYRGVKVEDKASSVFLGADTAEKAKHIIDLRL